MDASVRISRSAQRAAPSQDAVRRADGPAAAPGRRPARSSVARLRPSAVPAEPDNRPGEAPPIVREVLRGPGAPLDATTRGLMEERLGGDFGHVRVHTGARAAASARMVGALAYTHGSSVVFGSGRYAPHSAEGRDLLAHELAHTVQQRGTAPPSAHQRLGLEPPHSPVERGAHAIAQGAGTAAWAGPHGSAHGPAHALVARKISIRGESYTHGSKKGMTYLFNDVVAPELERRGYKTYGARARLVEFVKANDTVFQDEGAFLDAFIPWLQGQTRRVRNGVTPVLKQFSVMGMSRPAWPEELKELKGMVQQEQAADQQNKVKEKDNVRHVVRNATLKRALSIAFDRVGPGRQKDYFSRIAAALGIPADQHATVDLIVQRIYRALYLNLDNLFAGPGPMNQLIGFSADPVQAYGQELIDRGVQAEVSIVDVYNGVVARIYAAQGKIRGVESGNLQFLLNEIITTVWEAIGAIRPEGDESLVVPAVAAGEMVVDIGLGFGFDFIEGRVPADQQDIGERQGRLVWAETALQEFIRSGGEKGDLLEILQVFMGRPGVQAANAPGPGAEPMDMT